MALQLATSELAGSNGVTSSMRLVVAAFLLVSCTTPRDSQRSSSAAAQPSPSAAVEVPEPAPHYQEHPDIAPDELGERAEAGAGAIEPCSFAEPPPLSQAPPRIRSGPPVTNYIPPEIVMRPIRERAACLRRCYQAGLLHDPNLKGRVAVRFVIDADGWVRRARVTDNQLASDAVVECVRQVFLGLHYEEPDDAITVVYPVVFAPQ
ncbi:MAG: AgmX/PglI C-terminal domain-containing protein [Polyangiaceae bacterium]